MAINKATIVKEVDGVIEYIYPKTTADIVEYTADVSVKDKLDELESTISEANNQEVVDARVAKSDGLTKSSLKARIDADFVALNGAIASSISDADTQFQGRLNDAIDQFEQSTDAVLQAANGKNKVFHQTTAPAVSAGLTIGDTWFDTDDDYTMYRWDGTQWVKEQFDENAIANGAISNAKIKDATIEDAKIKWLDAGKLTAGYIDSNRIKVNELLSQNITATGTITGVTIDGGTIRGGNLDIGSTSQYIKYNSSTGNLDIKVNELTIGSSTAATTAQVTSAAGTAKSEAIAAAASTADDKIAAARQSIIDAAVASANSYTDSAISGVESGTTPKVISSTTILYFTKNVTSPAPAAPTAHVTSVSTEAGVWTTVVPTYNTSYKYYFTCAEYLYADNTYGWGPVSYSADLSTAVEDAYILNEISTIQAGEVKVKNGALYVDNEFVSSLFGYEITVPSNSGGSIKGPTIISNNYDGTVTTSNGIKSYAINNTAGSILQLTNGTFNFANKLKWDGSNLTIAANSITIGGVNAATTSNVTAAKNEAIAAAAQDADDKISDLQTELNGNITAAIEAAQLNSDKTITSATVLYYLSNSNITTPTAPSSHVSSVSTSNGVWTTKVPTCTNTYKYYYNCTEYLYDDNSYGWSSVTYNAELSAASINSYILNNLTNIGDGEVKIQNGALYVDTQFVNSLFARDITVPNNGSINGGIIKSLNYAGASTTNGIDNTAGSIIDLNNGYFNFGGGAMTFNGTTLNVTSGVIGGFQIGFENNAYLMRGQITDSSNVTHQYAFQAPDTDGKTSNAFYIRERAAGESTWDYPFRVRYDGYLKATKVDIEGKITCSSGTIGGFTIGSTLLRNVTTVSLNGKTIPVFAKNGVVTTGTGSGSYEARYFIQAPEGADGSTGNVFAAQYRPTTNNPNNDWINLFRARYDGHVICNALRSYNGIKSYGIAYFSNFTGSGNSTAENDFITIGWREAGSFDAPIIRGEVNNEAYLGSSNYRWNYIYLANAANVSSDKKIKDHIEYLADDENLEDFFYGLKPVMYKLKDSYGRRNHMGLYAQDVSDTANETIGDLAAFEAAVIDYDENGEKIELYYNPEDDIDDTNLSWGLKYEEFIAPTIAIVQKQHDRIVALEDENRELKDRLASIEERLAALEV